MEENFSSDGGGLQVRRADGKFQRVEVPEGYTDGAFRNAVAAADSAYRLNGAVPDLDDVYRFFPKLSKKVLGKLLATDAFAEAMELRGIRWADDSGLNIEQQTALMVLADPTDRRTTKAKLRDMGVSSAKYTAWQQDPLFMEVYRKRVEDNFSAAVPMAMNRMITNADGGDTRSIEKILEISGRYNPAQQQMQDAKAVVLTVIDAVQRHVPDVEVREAILSDIHSATLGFDVNNQQSLEQGRGR